MNPNQDNKNNKGGQGPKKRGFFVGALLWALVLVVIFNFIAGEIANAGIKEVTYSEFIQMVENNEVATAELANKQITFYLSKDLPAGITQPSGQSSDQDLAKVLAEQMEKGGATCYITAPPQGQGYRDDDLLPVLKENGVVDSGAFGFAIFLENFVAAALGRSTVVEDFSATFDFAGSARDAALGRVEIEANDDWEGSEFRYCNEFLFKADAPFDEDECLKFLGSMGDCELLVGAYPDYKIHVHSNTPNLVLEHMLQLGQIYEVFIHNMEMEAHDRTAKIHEDQEKAAEPAKALGFVAVAAGSGEADILKSLGVDVIVSGGQTMNPSTADLLGAVDQVNATSVIILPNNGNIRMAAEAAASACTDKKVAVVPTKTVPQAFSALFAVLPDSELEDAVAAMVDAISEVRDGEVTRAVRDSSASDGSPIHSGDVMGIIAGSIDVVGSDVKQVTLDCINRMQEEEEGDALTILAGEELSDEAFQEIVDAIEEAQPDLEIDAHRGEQPLYPVIFSIE